jgi:hypothetical protein
MQWDAKHQDTLHLQAEEDWRPIQVASHRLLTKLPVTPPFTGEHWKEADTDGEQA